MSLEAIRIIADAEDKVRQMKAAAAANAKKCIADARLSGEAMVEEAMKKAESELEALAAAATEEAGKSAREMVSKNEAAQLRMRDEAREKMTEAVAFIVERIVSG